MILGLGNLIAENVETDCVVPPASTNPQALHSFEFNGDLTDDLDGGGDLLINPLTGSSGYSGDKFWWYDRNHPGGGLILKANLDNPADYTVAFRAELNQTGPCYIKILSFKDTSFDEGVYLCDKKMYIYSLSNCSTGNFRANRYYDYIFTRDSATNTFDVYGGRSGESYTHLFNVADPNGQTIPREVNGLYEFDFFTDDLTTCTEFSNGGTIKSLKVWNGKMNANEVSQIYSLAVTKPATEIASNSAVINGLVNANGYDNSQSWFQWGIGSSLRYVYATPRYICGSTDTPVSYSLHNLQPNTTYTYRVKIKVNGVYNYGQYLTFTTVSMPEVTTMPTSFSSSTTAVLSGELVAGGDAQTTVRGFVYSTSPHPTLENATVVVATAGTGSYDSPLIECLLANTKYYYAAYASNVAGTAYGEVMQVVTLNPEQNLIGGSSTNNNASTDVEGADTVPVNMGNSDGLTSTNILTDYINHGVTDYKLTVSNSLPDENEMSGICLLFVMTEIDDTNALTGRIQFTFENYPEMEKAAYNTGNGWVIISPDDIELDGNKLTINNFYPNFTDGKIDILLMESDGTLPVEFDVFNAISNDDEVNIAWKTKSENDLYEYRIFRAEENILASADYINPQEQIAATNSPTGANYSYTDDTVIYNHTYYYWISAINLDGSARFLNVGFVYVEETQIQGGQTPVVPEKYGLLSNYPNPFNPSTTINFNVATDSVVKLEIFNIRGEKVKTFNKGRTTPGVHSIVWNGRDSNGNEVASGTYFCRLSTNGESYTHKMMMLK